MGVALTLAAIGDTIHFTAVSRDSEGNVTRAGVGWSSFNPQVATVGEFSGLATAVGNGTTTIRAVIPVFLGIGCVGGVRGPLR